MGADAKDSGRAAEDVRRAAVAAAGAGGEAEVRRSAKEIVARHGRDALVPLADVFMPPQPDRPESAFAAWALIALGDPDGRLGLEAAVERSRSLPGTALVAVGALGGEEARGILVRWAVGGWDSAAGLLRSDDPRLVKPLLEAAGDASSPTPDPVRALTSSFAFAESLEDPAALRAYRDFETRLWRAWAITHKSYRGGGEAYDRAAVLLISGLTDEDDRFVLRIIADASTTDAETALALRLAPYVKTPAMKQGLEAIASGGGLRAALAKKALEAVERGPAKKITGGFGG